jgi:YD repeat-containing protein
MAYANPDAVTQIANGLSTTTFTYDNNGNVVQKTVDGTTTTYVYDYANRLTALGVLGATTTYAFPARQSVRRTAATRMEEIGVSPFIVAHLLGHVSVTKASITSKVYARYDYASEKRAAVNRWDADLSGIVGGKASDILSLFDRGGRT